jgi:hypothetical protein
MAMRGLRRQSASTVLVSWKPIKRKPRTKLPGAKGELSFQPESLGPTKAGITLQLNEGDFRGRWLAVDWA